MKYALIIPDGCADEPQESLGGKTPLQAANIPAMDAIAAAGVVGRSEQHARIAAAGVRRGQLEPAGLQPAGTFHRPGAAGGRRPGNRPRPGRLGRPLQSGHRRGPGDEGFYGGPHLLGRSGGTAENGPGKTGLRLASVLSRRQLSEPADLSRRGPAGPFLARHPHHAAPRPDRQDRAGRLSPRAGQRSADAPDERERRSVRRSSGERRPACGGQAAGHQRLALGTRQHAAPDALRPTATASAGR